MREKTKALFGIFRQVELRFWGEWSPERGAPDRMHLAYQMRCIKQHIGRPAYAEMLRNRYGDHD